MITNVSRYQFDRIEMAHRLIVKEGYIECMLSCMTSVAYALAERRSNFENDSTHLKPFDLFQLDHLDRSIRLTLEGWMNLREGTDRLLDLSKKYDRWLSKNELNQEDKETYINDEEIETYNEYLVNIKTRIRELLPRINEKNINYRDKKCIRDKQCLTCYYTYTNQLDILTWTLQRSLKDIDSESNIDLSFVNWVYIIYAKINNLERSMNPWQRRRWYLTYRIMRMMVPVARFLGKI